MKYLCRNLRKQVQQLYVKNDITLMKEIKDLDKSRNILYVHLLEEATQ